MPSEADVGEILRRLDASRVLSGEELEQHIRDCETLWKRAYARFRPTTSPLTGTRRCSGCTARTKPS
jgi:hypothetical protein